jgi:hypothetical protein
MSGNEVVTHGGREIGRSGGHEQHLGIQLPARFKAFDRIMGESHAQLCDALQSRLQSQHRRGGDHHAAVHLFLTEVTDDRLKAVASNKGKVDR